MSLAKVWNAGGGARPKRPPPSCAPAFLFIVVNPLINERLLSRVLLFLSYLFFIVFSLPIYLFICLDQSIFIFVNLYFIFCNYIFVYFSFFVLYNLYVYLLVIYIYRHFLCSLFTYLSKLISHRWIKFSQTGILCI